MKQVVFTQKKVTSYLESNFVLVMLDIKKDKLPKEYSFVGIPTYIVIGEDGKKLGTLVGSMSADKFLNSFKGSNNEK